MWRRSVVERKTATDPGGGGGILFPAVPAGILFPVDPVGPIGPYGTLSTSDSDSVILVDPDGGLPSSDLAEMRVPDAPAVLAFLVGPVGPAMSLGVLPPSDTDSADPVIPTRMQSSSIFECAGPLGRVGTLLTGEHGTGLCPIVQTDELLSVVAVPHPAVRDPVITQLPVEGLVGECGDVVEESITVHECVQSFICAKSYQCFQNSMVTICTSQIEWCIIQN